MSGLALLALASCGRAQSTSSAQLKSQAEQLQQGIDGLNMSNSDLRPRISASLLSSLNSELKSKESALTSLQTALQRAQAPDQDVTELTALEKKMQGRASVDFLAKLDQEVDAKRRPLVNLAPEEANAVHSAGVTQAATRESPTGPAGAALATGPAHGPAAVGDSLPEDTVPSQSANPTPPMSGAGANQGGATGGTANPGGGTETTTKANNCTGTAQAVDCRSTFDVNAYAGLSIDSFAANDLNMYLNPNDSNKVKFRAVGGFDFAYRLVKGPCSESDKTAGYTGTADCGSTHWRHPQLWVYGETIHGVRSADVDCKANPSLSVCTAFQNNPSFSPSQTLYLLRNATSLEAFAGLRYEFLTVNPNSSSPAVLYFKSQAGYLTIAGAGRLTADHKTLALGAMATSGRFRESFLDFGFGPSKIFAADNKRRGKIDGYLTWDAFGQSYLRPFVEMTVDTAFGGASDSVQTYFGISFDVDCVFSSGANCK